MLVTHPLSFRMAGFLFHSLVHSCFHHVDHVDSFFSLTFEETLRRPEDWFSSCGAPFFGLGPLVSDPLGGEPRLLRRPSDDLSLLRICIQDLNEQQMEQVDLHLVEHLDETLSQVGLSGTPPCRCRFGRFARLASDRGEPAISRCRLVQMVDLVSMVQMSSN